MNKGNKQRMEVRKQLKQKLISYQNQASRQGNIVNYQGIHSTDSQQFRQSQVFRIESQHISPIPKNNRSGNIINEYNLYLHCSTLDDDININNKKSLTRHNIFAINKKAKAIKLSLNEMARQSKLADEGFVNWRGMRSGGLLKDEEKYKPSRLETKSKDSDKLGDNRLTIDCEKKNKTQKFKQTPKRPLSHQQTQALRCSSTERFSPQTPNRPKTSKTQYSSQRINPQIPTDLTEYFTPCYHKQTDSGYIVNSFQPRLKVKHFQDNVKIMAKVIKKKIVNLQRQEIINYLKQVGERKNNSRPYNTINQTVRKSNYLHEKNILEQKIKKGKKLQSAKRSSSSKI